MPRRSCGPSFALAILLCLPVASPAWPGDEAASGVFDPVISWGLSAITDWDTAPVFLDVARTMRPFFAFGTDWKTMSHDALRAGGYLDAQGYPTGIPPGSKGIRTVWAWGDAGPMNDHRKGTYVLTYQGTATITAGGAARALETGPGRIVMENPTGGTFWLDITAIDPADHPRAFSLLRSDHVALAEAGAVFDPVWLSLVSDARELRFMDWQRTNDMPATGWNGRPRPEDATYAARGVPLEVMIRLANEAGVDPWFTMRHDAGADDVRAFATLVRDRLDPRLKVHVEYSNETWNGAFPQFDWLRRQAVADWGPAIADDWDAIFDYQTKRATETARVWQEVFGATAPTRLVNILGTQLGNAWLTERQLTAEEWRAREPDRYIPPADTFQEVAATTYFGASVVLDPDRRARVLEFGPDGQEAANRWLHDLLARPGDLDSVPETLVRLSEQKALVNAAGLRLVAYEGGQHLHHSFAVDGLSDAEAEALSATLARFVRSDAMGDLYARLGDGWRRIGDGPFMQFTEMGSPSRWGSWGLLSQPGDRTARSDMILRWQAEGGSWWGEGGGPQYLQGITRAGTAGNDRMGGTDEEDFLAGLAGDDHFAASPGADGISGGDGTDSYDLPLGPSSYRVETAGSVTTVSGPDGRATLRGIERITFGDGSARMID